MTRDDDQRERKARSNRAHHARLRNMQEHLLLRLQPGDRARVDAGASACGLSRAAFAQLYLVPFAAALTPGRVAKLAELSSRQCIGLAAVFGRLIDRAELSAPSEPPVATLAAEFDELFGAER